MSGEDKWRGDAAGHHESQHQERHRIRHELLRDIRKNPQRYFPEWRLRGLLIIGQGKIETMSFDIQTGQTKTATAVFTDAQGVVRPLPAGHIPAWSASPPDVLTLAPAADGMTCALTGLKAGNVTVMASVEGDPTPGVDTIVATIDGVDRDPEDTVGTITVA